MSELLIKRKKLNLLKDKLDRVSERDLGAFIVKCKKDYERPSHLEPLIKFFNDVSNGKERHLAMTVPPRHGKTETAIHGIPYFLNKNRTKTVAYISYSQTQSVSKAVKSHQVIQELGWDLHPKLNNRAEFRLAEGGGILTTAVGGSLTGQGVDLLIIDDPFSNYKEAYSKTTRQAVWDWYEYVAETRLEPNASVLIVHTRWHEDDLIGRLIESRDRYEFIRIPAIEDGLDAFGKEEVETLRELGEALWESRYPISKLEEIKTEREHSFVSMYQGLPRAKEDYLFQDYGTYEKEPEGLRLSICSDLAYTEKEIADSSCIVVMGEKDGTYYILDVYKYQKDIQYSIKLMKRLYEQYTVKIGVEANGPQKAVYDIIKKEVPVVRLKPIGDKYTRALEYAESWNNGKVLLPKQAKWKADFVQEHQSFTGVKDAHDDQVDAGAYAFNRLRKVKLFVV